MQFLNISIWLKLSNIHNLLVRLRNILQFLSWILFRHFRLSLIKICELYIEVSTPQSRLALL
jgi:hypothetical protein